MTKIKVCIVEDQVLIQKSLKIVLESMANIEIIGMASNGQEALEICAKMNPDIVLMDIQMPIMDGVEATRILKGKYPFMKVIILTTFQEVHYVSNALQAGAEGYILKAVDPQFLIKGIELVHHGGTLVPQEIAKTIFHSIKSTTEQEQTYNNPYKLSDREIDVLYYLSKGLTNKAIAETLFLSVGTIKNYISIIYSKLNVENRALAAKMAVQENLVPIKKQDR
ncbi:response regulator transcription factor [Bacillus sp. S13(2024)]|uniref:response regulator transcription factor n=1 Tax=unclassified Bacillus (in: firmicutes) TaxID=185979 RepID=UPI003D20114E